MASIPLFEIIYPERRLVTAQWIVMKAKDRLANDYMESHPEADDAAIEENSRLRPDEVLEAMYILSDAGDVTFRAGVFDYAESL